MDNRKTVLICDDDFAFLDEMEKKLGAEGYDVDTIVSATELIPCAIRLQPGIIIANPDLPNFNEQDICKHIIKEGRIEFILLAKNSATQRFLIGDCKVRDVITKPVDIATLVAILDKYVSVIQ